MAADPDRTTLYEVTIDATNALKAWDELIARAKAFETAGKTAVTQIQAQMNRLGGVVTKGSQSIEKVVAAQAKVQQSTQKSAEATKKAEEATARYRDAALRLAENARLVVDALREEGKASQEVVDGLTKSIEASARSETAWRSTGEAGREAQIKIREEIKNTLGQQQIQADQQQRLRELASRSLRDAAASRGQGSGATIAAAGAEEQLATRLERSIEATNRVVEADRALAEARARLATVTADASSTEEQRTGAAKGVADAERRRESAVKNAEQLASAERNLATARAQLRDVTRDANSTDEQKATAQANLVAATRAHEQAVKSAAGAEATLGSAVITSNDARSQAVSSTERIQSAASQYELELRKQIDALLKFAGVSETTLTGATAGHQRVNEAVKDAFGAQQNLSNAIEKAAQAEVNLVAAQERHRAVAGNVNSTARERVEVERQVADAMSTHISAQSNLRQATGQYINSVRQVEKAEKQRTAEIKLQSQAASEGIKTQRQVEGELRRQLKTYPELVKSLGQLVDKYGTFRVTLGNAGEAMNEADKEARELIGANAELSKEVQRLAELTRGGTFSLQLDRPSTQVRTFNDLLSLTPFQIREITRAFDQMGLRGLGTFGSLVSVIGPLGLGIAGVGFAISGVIQLMVKLGEVGIKTFLKLVDLSTQLVESSVEVASGFDSVEKSLVAMLGSAEAASGVMSVIREQSEAAGVDFEEIVRKLGPVVGGVQRAIQLGQASLGLAQLDPKQGVKGGLRVIQDALQGNLQPLRKTFAIDVDPIRKAQEELGNVEGLLVGLEEVLKQRGLDFKTMSDTWIFAVGRMQEIWRTLQGTLGEPVVESLIDQFNDLADFFKENRDLFLIIFNAIGIAVEDVLSKFIDLGGTALEGFDEEKAYQIADSFIAIVTSIGAMFDALTGIQDVDDPLSLLPSPESIQKVAEAFIVLSGIVRGYVSNLVSWFKIVSEVSLQAVLGIGDYRKVTEELGKITSTWVEVGKDTIQVVQQYRADLDALSQSNRDFAASQQESTDAALAFAEAVLAEGKALSDISDLNEELEPIYKERTELYEDHNAALEKAGRERIDSELDAELDLARALVDLDMDTSRKRQDAWEKHYDKIEEIRIKNDQDIVDAATDLSDKEADLLRKHNRDLADLEREDNKRRLKLEEEYQDKLAELQRKFLFDAEEAVRDNDAVRFLELKRRYEFERNELKIDRDKKLEDEEDAAEERRQKLRESLQREIEDAQIAHDRKLRDLEVALQRAYEAQGRALAAEIEQINQAEERKRADIQLAYERQIEDIKAAFDRKIREMEIAYNRELALITNKEAQIVAKIEEANKRLAAAMAARRAILASGIGSAGAAAGGEGFSSPTLPAGATPTTPGYNSPDFESGGSIGGQSPPPIYLPIPRHEHGGSFMEGKPIIVGESGIEGLIPEFRGRVIPNRDLRDMMFSPPAHLNRAMTTFDNRRTLEASINMVNPAELHPAAVAEIVNIVSKMLIKANTP